MIWGRGAACSFSLSNIGCWGVWGLGVFKATLEGSRERYSGFRFSACGGANLGRGCCRRLVGSGFGVAGSRVEGLVPVTRKQKGLASKTVHSAPTSEGSAKLEETTTNARLGQRHAPETTVVTIIGSHEARKARRARPEWNQAG